MKKNYEEIEYIEVSVYDGATETTGLLTHFGTRSKSLRLLTDTTNTYELFNLKYFTITRIMVGKSTIELDIEDQYIFKMDEDDQNIAITVLLNSLQTLELEGKTNGQGFINKEAFANPPERYLNKTTNKQTSTSAKTTTTVGGTSVSEKVDDKKTTTGNTTVHRNNYNDTYAKRNKKTVVAFYRTSKLPSKAFLNKMKLKVMAVRENTFKKPLPETAEDEVGHNTIAKNRHEALIGDYCAEDYGHYNGHDM